MDVYVMIGDSRSNRSRDIRLPHFEMDGRTTTTPAYAGHHKRVFVQFAFCSVIVVNKELMTSVK